MAVQRHVTIADKPALLVGEESTKVAFKVWDTYFIPMADFDSSKDSSEWILKSPVVNLTGFKDKANAYELSESISEQINIPDFIESLNKSAALRVAVGKAVAIEDKGVVENAEQLFTLYSQLYRNATKKAGVIIFPLEDSADMKAMKAEIQKLKEYIEYRLTAFLIIFASIWLVGIVLTNIK